MRFYKSFHSSVLNLILAVLMVLQSSPAAEGFGNASDSKAGDWKTVVGTENSYGKAVEIGPRGGAVTLDSEKVQISIPPRALNRNIPITIERSSIEFQRDPESTIRASDIMLAGALELGPSGTTFSAPITVTMEIPPEALKRVREGQKLLITVANGDILSQVRQYHIDERSTVSFQLEHFSAAFIFAMGGLVIVSLGMLAGRMIATDSPHIMIQPEHKNVQNFVQQGNVSLPATINHSGVTDLGINKTFKGTMGYLKTINGGAALVKMKNGSKVNCQDLTFLAASVLLSTGDPRFKNIICVGGKASLDGYSGDHMWLEVEVDGRVYALDTTNARRLTLMPASEAYDKFNLVPSFEFGYRKRRKPYKGWDGRIGPDIFGRTTNSTTAEPSQATLNKAFSDGKEMGCRHQSMNTDAIKQELRDVYGSFTHPKIKERFRRGYAKGGQECRPQ
jgi:hypothetical protein